MIDAFKKSKKVDKLPLIRNPRIRPLGNTDKNTDKKNQT